MMSPGHANHAINDPANTFNIHFTMLILLRKNVMHLNFLPKLIIEKEAR